MPDGTEPTTNENTSILTEVKSLLANFMSALSQASPTFLPYTGTDKNLYVEAGEGENLTIVPVADYVGNVSTRSLMEALATIGEQQLTPEERSKVARKLYTVAAKNDIHDDTLETQLFGLTRDGIVIDTSLADEQGNKPTLYEFAFTGDAAPATVENSNLIYRNVIRTGQWKLAPNSDKPLVITKQMLDDMVAGFQDNAFEYVTVPETHRDLPSENRGFIKALEVVPDAKRDGEYILRAGFEFTNDAAKNAVLEGSIAGVSCGILFEHRRKSDGKAFKNVLHHVALTNKPWIDGLGGWEKIAASEYDADVVVGLEDSTEENTDMTGTTGTTLSQEQQAEFDRLVAENKQLKLSQHRAAVTEQLRAYQSNNNLTPAVLKAAEKMLLAAAVEPKMTTLSDDNTQTELDLAATVKELLDAIPTQANLTEPPVTPDQTAPPATTETKTPEQKAEELRQLAGFSTWTPDELEAK